MNQSDDWQHPPGWKPDSEQPPPPGGYGMQPPPYGYNPGGFAPPSAQPYPKKSKVLSLFLSLMMPGLGHMYLGLMSKGIMLMLLLAVNICGVVFAGIEYGGSGDGSVLIIVLLSLLIPILYFYSLFDALQKADWINDRRAAGWPSETGWNGASPGPFGGQQQVPVVGIVLLVVGAVVLFSTANNGLTRWLLHSNGSKTGAIVLVAIGAVVWLWERRGRSDKRD